MPGRIAAACFALLLRMFPARHRTRYGAEMLDLFLREGRVLLRERGVWAALRFVVLTYFDLAIAGWRERRRKLARAAHSASGVVGVGRTLIFFEIPWLDLKLALRMLVRLPGLTVVAVSALAVGIPAGLAPAHVARVHKAPLPVHDGDRIRVLRYVDAATGRPQSPFIDDFARWRYQLTSFDNIAFATIRRQYNLIRENGQAAPVQGSAVTSSFFDLFATPPLFGRRLIQADDVRGAPSVVVIGYELWRSLGGDPGIVGRSVRIGGLLRNVVGVMPENFYFPYRDQFWLPLQGNVGAGESLPAPGAGYLVFGRLKVGVPPEKAEAEFKTVRDRWAREFPNLYSDHYARLRPQVVPFTIGLYEDSRLGALAEPRYLAAQTLALLVLLATCANVGMLLFARTAARSSELAVRTALGASRRRIVMQLFVESLVLAILGAGVGLFAADRLASVILKDFLAAQPHWIYYGITFETVFWGMTLAAASAAIAGTIPALKVTGRSLRKNVERAGGRSSHRFGWLSDSLVVSNVVLAVATVGAGMFLTSRLIGLEAEATKVPDEFITAEINIPSGAVPQRPGPFDIQEYTSQVLRMRGALVERLQSAPGVRGVALADALPGDDYPTSGIEIESEPQRMTPGGHHVRTAHVHPGFFVALGRPVLAGRDFDARDLDSHTSSVIVSTTFVDRVMGGRNPLGQRVRYVSSGESSGPWYEIVGVAQDLAVDGRQRLREAGYDRTEGTLYHALSGADRNLGLALRIGVTPALFAPRLRAMVAAIDPSFIVSEPQTLQDIVASRRFETTVLIRGTAFLTAFLVVLAASGIYTLMSFTVMQRRREFAIRSALGAPRSTILFAVAQRSLVQLAGGSLLGGLIAWWLLRQAQGFLGEVRGNSSLSLAVLLALGVLVLVAALACTTPVLRALRIMPAEALKEGAA
jgi:putative ABC transport system permease protein